MPYVTEWADPELFLLHAGVAVWRTYKNDDFESGTRTYSFTLDPGCGDDGCNESHPCPCENVFDVRDKGFDDPKGRMPTDDELRVFLRAQIDAGMLKNPPGVEIPAGEDAAPG